MDRAHGITMLGWSDDVGLVRCRGAAGARPLGPREPAGLRRPCSLRPFSLRLPPSRWQSVECCTRDFARRALAALEADAIASAWMPDLMRSSYTSLKRLEQELAAAQSPEELCRRHAAAY